MKNFLYWLNRFQRDLNRAIYARDQARKQTEPGLRQFWREDMRDWASQLSGELAAIERFVLERRLRICSTGSRVIQPRRLVGGQQVTQPDSKLVHTPTV